MKKHGTKRPVVDPSISALTPASTRQIPLPGVVLDARIALREFLLAAGMKALLDELEADRTMLCGPRGKFRDDRQAYRHGHDIGRLVMGGRKCHPDAYYPPVPDAYFPPSEMQRTRRGTWSRQRDRLV